MYTATCPEDAFLESNLTISSIDMINCLVGRSEAVLQCLQLAMGNADFTPNRETVENAIWQVTGNLTEINKVAAQWHRSERVGVPVCAG